MSDPPVNFLIPFPPHVRGTLHAQLRSLRHVASRREIRGSSHGYARSPTGWAEAACVTNLTPRRYRRDPDSHLRFVPGSCQR